jgi:hypothetical protein
MLTNLDQIKIDISVITLLQPNAVPSTLFITLVTVFY